MDGVINIHVDRPILLLLELIQCIKVKTTSTDTSTTAKTTSTNGSPEDEAFIVLIVECSCCHRSARVQTERETDLLALISESDT